MDGNCRHEIKRPLLPGRKAMIKLDSILKGRDITFQMKVHIVKAMAFPIIRYRWESWNIKKIDHWRIDAFEMWCWRRHLRVCWTARRSNQSILNEIDNEHTLEGLWLRLKLQYFDQLMWRADSLEKILMLGKTEGRKRKRWQRMRGLAAIINSVDEFEQAQGDSEGQGGLMVCSSWDLKESD